MSKGPFFLGRGRIRDQKGSGVGEVGGEEGVRGAMRNMRGQDIGEKKM